MYFALTAISSIEKHSKSLLERVPVSLKHSGWAFLPRYRCSAVRFLVVHRFVLGSWLQWVLQIHVWVVLSFPPPSPQTINTSEIKSMPGGKPYYCMPDKEGRFHCQFCYCIGNCFQAMNSASFVWHTKSRPTCSHQYDTRNLEQPLTCCNRNALNKSDHKNT